MPAILQIPGMPALGFWELEDPQHDPGRIDAAPGDTARLLLVESVLSYASDWFLLPLRLPVAALHRIDSLEVTDTFGVTTRIRPVEEVRHHPGWRLWRVTGLPYLFLPPPSAGFISGEAVERVAFKFVLQPREDRGRLHRRAVRERDREDALQGGLQPVEPDCRVFLVFLGQPHAAGCDGRRVDRECSRDR